MTDFIYLGIFDYSLQKRDFLQHIKNDLHYVKVTEKDTLQTVFDSVLETHKNDEEKIAIIKDFMEYNKEADFTVPMRQKPEDSTTDYCVFHYTFV